jgi:outer membrane protein
MKKILLSISLALTWGAAQAQTSLQVSGTSEKLSLQQCVDIALKNNISVKQSDIQQQTAALQAQQARNNRLPNANANVNESFSFGRSLDPFTNSFISQNINFTNVSINAGVTLYNGNLLKNTIAQNDILLKASQMDMQAMKENIALQVVLAYLNVLNTEDQLVVAKLQSDATRLQITRTEKLVNAGSLPVSNLLDLKAQLANEESTIVNTQSTLDIARLTLVQLLNDRRITDVQLDRISVPTPSTKGYDDSIDKVYRAAEEGQAVVKAADLRVQSAMKGIEIARAGFLPIVSASGSWGANQSNAQRSFKQDGVETRTLGNVTIGGQTIPVQTQQPRFVEDGIVPFFEQLSNSNNYSFGVNVNIPIFNRFQNKTRVSVANLQKFNADLEAQRVRLTLRQNIEQAYVNMNNAARRYDALTTQVEALQESFRAAESRFNAGAIDFVAYNVQKATLDRAKSNQIIAKYDFVFRVKVLDFYQGKPLGF